MISTKQRKRLKMSERNIGLEILEGIREIKAYKAGEIDLKTRELSDPSAPKEIRAKLHLSQAAFAGLMGVSLRTVQDWEQGRREPSGPAKSLLRIAEQHPEIFVQLA
jgi:putative transcriptional regulator